MAFVEYYRLSFNPNHKKYIILLFPSLEISIFLNTPPPNIFSYSFCLILHLGWFYEYVFTPMTIPVHLFFVFSNC